MDFKSSNKGKVLKNDKSALVKEEKNLSPEFKVQVLVKDGLNVKSRMDRNGIFKIQQASSQEQTFADTTGHSGQMKKFMLNEHSLTQRDGDSKGLKFMSQNSQTYNRFYNVTCMLDKLSQKGVSSKKRQEAATNLKQIFQEIMIENQELKQRADRIVNNSNDSAQESSNSRAKEKHENMATAGSLIDNFGSEKIDESALLEQVSRLQAKVWTLQSENDLLNQKMIQMIHNNEQKDYQIKTINNQLSVILSDLQPKSAMKSHKGPSSVASGSHFCLKSPSSMKDQDVTFANHNSEPQENKKTRAEQHGLQPRVRGKFNSQSQFSKPQSSYTNLLTNDLDAIESDKEGEDILTSIQKPGNYFRRKLENNNNNELFENYEKSNVKSEQLKPKAKSPERIISELDDDALDPDRSPSDDYDSSDTNQRKLLDDIKENIYKIRKLTKVTTVQNTGTTPTFHQRTRSRYLNDYKRQDSRSFKEDPFVKPRSRSAMRNSNGGDLAANGSGDQYLQTETASNAPGHGVNYAGINHLNTPRSNSNHFFRSGSEAPNMASSQRRSQFQSSSRDRKLEPKSTWEPNEQGEQCKICQSKFNILKRKHHCRKCGHVVCASCSGNNWYVPGYADQKVRMCDQCYKEWMAYRVQAHNINKTSVFSSYFGNNQIPPSNH